MSTSTILRELATLKSRLDQLEETTAAPAGQRWRKVVGSIKPNALTREAARLGAKWRAAENKRK
jgi:hypothetical protein